MGVTDIEHIVRKWAGHRYAQVNEQEEINVSPENTTFEIDWSKVRFSTARTGFPRLDDIEDPLSCQQTPPRSYTVFKSNYENKTEEVQNHSFQMDRTTDATVRTKLTKGFSRNGMVGIKIDVPGNVSNQTGTFGDDIHVVSEDENTVKHGISWGLNTTVKAPANMRTVAELKITETECECIFESEVKLRGRVLVRVLNEEPPHMIEGDLATILKDEADERKLKANGMMSIQGRKVTWIVSGSLRFKFGVSQDVKVWSEKMPKSRN